MRAPSSLMSFKNSSQNRLDSDKHILKVVLTKYLSYLEGTTKNTIRVPILFI